MAACSHMEEKQLIDICVANCLTFSILMFYQISAVHKCVLFSVVVVLNPVTLYFTVNEVHRFSVHTSPATLLLNQLLSLFL